MLEYSLNALREALEVLWECISSGGPVIEQLSRY
jgi:hypothetical protein